MTASQEVPPEVAGQIEAELDRKAREFAAAHAARQAELDAARNKRNRRVQRQFWFLFAFLTIAFALLAYRTQTNDSNLREAQYNGCVKRANVAVTFNEGRLALIDLVLATPANKELSPTDKAAMVQRLRGGLLLPVEDCSALDHD